MKVNIKLLVLDVDGTLTDGTIFHGNQCIELKAYNVKDGLILKALADLGIEVVFLTGRTSEATSVRAKELNAVAIQGVDDKLSVLTKLLLERGIDYKSCAYFGDDMNDYEVMSKCGFKACPSDAAKEIIEICDYVSSKNGGKGAVRDICEVLLQKCGMYGDFLALYNARDM